MGTYITISTISPALREAHFQAQKSGGRMPEEVAPVNEAHLQYWKDLKTKGKALAGGPTVAFTWALGLVRADSLEEARALAENDPFVKGGLLTDLKIEAWYHII